MAILTTFRHSGDPDALLAKYYEKLAPVIQEAGPANGHISTTMVRTETGLMVLSVGRARRGCGAQQTKWPPWLAGPGCARRTGRSTTSSSTITASD